MKTQEEIVIKTQAYKDVLEAWSEVAAKKLYEPYAGGRVIIGEQEYRAMNATIERIKGWWSCR